MYPDLKFTNQGEGDINFAPFSIDSPINTGLFIPEEFVEEFRTSSDSTNPLAFDLRGVILSADISNDDADILEVRSGYETSENYLKNTLFSYNLNENSEPLMPLECDGLRDLNLNVDGKSIDLDKNFEENYKLNGHYPKGCNPNMIFNRIEKLNPRILYMMQRYRIPYPVAKTLTMQIINLTLNYCSREEG